MRVEYPLLSVAYSPVLSSITNVMEIRSYFLHPLASMTMISSSMSAHFKLSLLIEKFKVELELINNS